MDVILGIDIGGTAIKAGLFSTSGEFLGEKSVSTPALVDEAAYAVMLDALEELVASSNVPEPFVVGCGLDIPGPICEDGTLGFLPNAEIDLDGLKAAIRERFPTTFLAVVNDANAAALGELWQGAARDYPSFIMVTLGTGVGGGVIVGDQLVAGKHGAAGEMGHMTVNLDEEEICGCGRRGCLEQYASATGLVRQYRKICERENKTPYPIEHKTDAFGVFQALSAGDECAKEAISQMCEYLAFAFSQLACTVDPSAFVLGGGVAGSLDVFHDELVERYRHYCLPLCAGTPVIAATLGNRAGMYGSAYEALRLSRAVNSQQA